MTTLPILLLTPTPVLSPTTALPDLQEGLVVRADDDHTNTIMTIAGMSTITARDRASRKNTVGSEGSPAQMRMRRCRSRRSRATVLF